MTKAQLLFLVLWYFCHYDVIESQNVVLKSVKLNAGARKIY